jgi:hypothetical protein
VKPVFAALKGIFERDGDDSFLLRRLTATIKIECLSMVRSRRWHFPGVGNELTRDCTPVESRLDDSKERIISSLLWISCRSRHVKVAALSQPIRWAAKVTCRAQVACCLSTPERCARLGNIRSRASRSRKIVVGGQRSESRIVSHDTTAHILERTHPRSS